MFSSYFWVVSGEIIITPCPQPPTETLTIALLQTPTAGRQAPSVEVPRGGCPPQARRAPLDPLNKQGFAERPPKHGNLELGLHDDSDDC